MKATQIKRKNDRDFINAVKEESSQCSLQGLSYIFQSNQTIFGKVFWTFVVLSMLLLSTYWSYSMYAEWQLSPVLTTVTSTAFPVEEIEFPAVTICGFGMIEEAFNAGIMKQFFNYLTEMNVTPAVTPFEAQKLLYVKDIKDMNETEKLSLSQLNGYYSQFNNGFTKKASATSIQNSNTKCNQSLTDVVLLLASPSPDFRAASLINEGSKFPKNLNSSIGKKDTTVNGKPIENVFDAEKRAAFSKILNDKISGFKSHFKNDRSESISHLLEILWQSFLPCFDTRGITAERDGQNSILKQCRWKGVIVPCSAIFKKFPTDQGLCCTFNMKAADEIFNMKAYYSLIKKLQKFDEENSFGNSTKPDWYSKNNEPKSTSGKKQGLQIVLDAHSNILASGSVVTDFQGFVGLIHNRDSFPMVSKLGFQIRPGSNNLVALSAVQIGAKDGIRTLNPKQRNCLFPDENKNIYIYKKYTQTNCLLECSLLYAKKKVSEDYKLEKNCTPWYYPFRDRTSAHCDPWQAKSFNEIVRSNDNKRDCSHCLPDCQKTIYSPTLTATPFRMCDDSNFGVSQFCQMNLQNLTEPYVWSQQVLDEYNESIPNVESNLRVIRGNPNFFSKLNHKYNAYEKDIAVLEIFWETQTVLFFSSEQRQNWIGFLSNIGGILGLCIGISIVTFVEIFWTCIQIGLRLLK